MSMHSHLMQVRPNASDGLWLGFLVPVAISIGVLKHNIGSSELYRHSFFLCLGILYITSILIIKYVKSKSICISNKYFTIPAFAISVLFYMFLNKEIIWCCYGGVLSTLGFYKIYILTLKKIPLCFTLGEALIFAQGITIFFYSTTVNLYQTIHIPPKTSLKIATLVIQMGLSSLALICYLAYRYQYFRTTGKFYTMSVIILIFFLLLPLQLLLKYNPIIWLLTLLTKDINTLMMFIYWILCSSCAVYAVSKQIKGAQKASTVVRKSFHILSVLVFFPGLLFECTILYLASGVVLGVFIALELLRNLNIPPLGASLQDGFMVFSDEKDTGAIALTPMYLLVGCSLPLWLHPVPCDLTDSAGFSLLPLSSGLLSVGIGDTVASYVGTLLGKHKWSGSNKTMEGTLGCILSQLVVIYLLFSFGYCNLQKFDIIKIPIAITVVALVEAKTTQVDNLVLPLLMYSILL